MDVVKILFISQGIGYRYAFFAAVNKTHSPCRPGYA